MVVKMSLKSGTVWAIKEQIEAGIDIVRCHCTPSLTIVAHVISLRTITAPSLHHRCTIAAPSLTITSDGEQKRESYIHYHLRHHCTAQCQYCNMTVVAITAPTPHHRPTIVAPSLPPIPPYNSQAPARYRLRRANTGHSTVTTPSLHQNFTSTAPSPPITATSAHHRSTIPVSEELPRRYDHGRAADIHRVI